MSVSGWVHIDVLLIRKATDKAILCAVDGVDGEHWIPLSQICDPDDYEEGMENCTMSVTEWIAREKGFEVE